MNQIIQKTSLNLIFIYAILCGAALSAPPSFCKIAKETLESKVALKPSDKTRISLSEDSKKELSTRTIELFERGLTSQKKKKFKAALALYQQVLKEKPGLFEAEYNSGLCQEALGQYSKAKSTFEKLVKQDPMWDIGYKHLAFLSFKQGNHESALGYQKKYLSICRP